MKTIYSLVTKPINQNVAIIRISGPESFDFIKSIFPDFSFNKNTITHKKLFNKKEFIDEVLILTFVAPDSFTGEDVIEIQSHGSMFVVNKILTMLSDFGLKQSDPGEFMKQAYTNNKIDLTQSEAINTLILTNNQTLANKSSLNLNGLQSSFIKESLNKIEKIIANIQVTIDYPENQDLPKYNLKQINKDIKNLKKNLDNIIYDSSRLIKYSKGIVISLVGLPNVGKSTLLNSILKEDRAIVSDIEGTTRDIVESSVYINGVKITLQDTAGIRKETDDKIEKIGISKSIEAINNSDIILFLIDGTKPIDKQRKIFKDILSNNKDKVIEVFTKSDLKKNKGLSISATEGDINNLLDSINKFIKDFVFDIDKNNNALLITQNQINKFNEVSNSLKIVSKGIENNETIDLIAFELENSMKILAYMLGKEINQEYILNLFSNFCVGK